MNVHADRPDLDDFVTGHLPRQARATTRRSPHLVWRDADGDKSITIRRLALIGSTAKADVHVTDPTVSRLHAELEIKDDELWVRDLGSRNGTFVEELQVGSARVPEGARIRVGSTVLVNQALTDTTVELWPSDEFGGLVGGSPIMRELFATLSRVAQRDTTVLLSGETGTGKEIAARALHDASPRSSRPFVIVDCGALPEHLLESELFGHARGAFTGAVAARAGAIEAANGGTVFLDEIGELPLQMQPKLLRVLESRTVRRLGETAHRNVDVRFVSATHRDLRSMVNAKTFREDLYFRLAVIPLAIPPLRKHLEDVAMLAERFMPHAEPHARAALVHELVRRPWLGNVRELRNFIERATALGISRAVAIAAEERNGECSATAEISGALPFGRPYKEYREETERQYIEKLVEQHRGNVNAMAEAADVDRTYIYRLIRKHAR